MEKCSRHGPYFGQTCPTCDRQDDISRERHLYEEAEREAANRHWEAQVAADYRARELQEQQQALVRDAHTIQASSLLQRARQLLKAGLHEEAAETCRDALQKDRGYLSAYALLVAAEYDNGHPAKACEALDKAIRLLGHGEWRKDSAYIEVLAKIESREFPDPLLQTLRTKLGAFAGEVSANLLTWVASRGWSAEVLSLLPRSTLTTEDLVKIASWLIADAPGAARELTGRAVSQLAHLGDKAKPDTWLAVASLSFRLELENDDGEHRIRLFELMTRWPEDSLLNALGELSTSPRWKDLNDLKAEFVFGMFAEPTAKALNAQEDRAIAKARAEVPETSQVVGWLPAVKKRDLERRDVAASSAMRASRERASSFLLGVRCEKFLILEDRWKPTSLAAKAVAAYNGEAHYQRGLRLEKNGRHGEAAAAFCEARKLFSAAGNGPWELDTVHWQGWCLYSGPATEVKWVEAFQCFGDAAELGRRLALPVKEASNVYWQAMCLEAKDNTSRDLAAASDLYRRAIDIDRSSGGSTWAAAAHFRLGSLAEEAGSKAIALTELRHAELCFGTAGDEQGRAKALRRIGFNLCPGTGSAGDCIEAIETFRLALELDKVLGNRSWQIWDLFELSWCHKPSNSATGNWNQTIELLQEAHQLAVELEDRGWQAKCLFHLGWSLEPTENPDGSWQTAIDHHMRAVEIARLGKSDYWEAEALNSAGWCYQPSQAPFGDWNRARELCERAVTAWRRTNDREGLARSLFNSAKCLSSGDRQSVTLEARDLFNQASQLFLEARNEKRAADAAEWAES